MRFLAASSFWLGVLVSLPAGAPAQTGEVEVKHLDARPVVLATLRAGENKITTHLLIDFLQQTPLLLHRNTASFLEADHCDVEFGTIKLANVALEVRRDRPLEGLTARYARELGEVPVSGRLGLAAFGDLTVVLDGPGKRFLVQGAGADPAEVKAAIELPADPRREVVQVPLALGRGTTARFILDSREPHGSIDPALCAKLGKPDGVLETAALGELDFARLGPFRPQASQNGHQGGIGARMLARVRVTVELGAGRIAFSAPSEAPYPEDEAAFYRALHGAEPVTELRAWLDQHRASGFRREVAHALLKSAASAASADHELLATAALAAIGAAPEDGRGGEALGILEALPDEAALRPLRARIARAGLEQTRGELDGSVPHRLRIELGRIEREQGNFKEARRHLLAAVFGAPEVGLAHLELGRLHEAAGEWERARGRFFQAMLDPERTAEAGLLAFTKAHEKMGGTRDNVIDAIEELGDGRLPGLHPIPREPETVQPTGRVVLLELFTGAQCPPCAGADVAFDALGEFYREDEVARIAWHLPIPAPEPMVCEAARARARKYGVRGTPTLVFAGGEKIAGGGKADQASEIFARNQRVLAPLLKLAPGAKLEGKATLSEDEQTLQLELTTASAKGLALHAVLVEKRIAWPGRNGIVVHRDVARAAFTPEVGAPAGDGAQEFRLARREVQQALAATIAELEGDRPFLVRPTELELANLQVVAFLEDPVKGEVVQAVTIGIVPATKGAK